LQTPTVVASRHVVPPGEQNGAAQAPPAQSCPLGHATSTRVKQLASQTLCVTVSVQPLGAPGTHAQGLHAPVASSQPSLSPHGSDTRPSLVQRKR
jgi:hypothetical protein